jgi:hypothetical protein
VLGLAWGLITPRRLATTNETEHTIAQVPRATCCQIIGKTSSECYSWTKSPSNVPSKGPAKVLAKVATIVIIIKVATIVITAPRRFKRKLLKHTPNVLITPV